MRWFVPAKIHRQTLPITARRCGLCPPTDHQPSVYQLAGVDLCQAHLDIVRAVQRESEADETRGALRHEQPHGHSSCQSRQPCV